MNFIYRFDKPRATSEPFDFAQDRHGRRVVRYFSHSLSCELPRTTVSANRQLTATLPLLHNQLGSPVLRPAFLGVVGAIGFSFP